MKAKEGFAKGLGRRLLPKAKKALAEGQSPHKELEVSGLYLLVLNTVDTDTDTDTDTVDTVEL